MLGRLIQTATTYGKGNVGPESVTEEAHTRSLLYGQSQHGSPFFHSPPPSPYTGPAPRLGTFDDRGGLELEEKDLRIIIAQDAYGTEEKPSVLFDSATPVAVTQTTPSHSRNVSQGGSRSPLPRDWKPAANTGPESPRADVSPRYKSSTISGSSSAWARPSREAATREETFLECMFGVTSSTKSGSTTKLHLMPGKQIAPPVNTVRSPTSPEFNDVSSRRGMLQRSNTSYVVARQQPPTPLSLDTETAPREAVLITRLFNVALPETIASKSTSASDTLNQVSDVVSPASPEAKKHKLVERKVPAFAIGIIVYLPYRTDKRPPTRPGSRTAHVHSSSSASSSYGSDVQNTFSFIEAIPESLWKSTSSAEEPDRRMEILMDNWDVILRSLATLQTHATSVILDQLMQVLSQVTGPAQKLPKEKSMQRINQRIISITDSSVIAGKRSLQIVTRRSIRRICYALRIPRVITGLGFAIGHWSDEARTLYRICGRRQQNFFLFNLLTAFLGSHTQWLQRLAPDGYRKQFRATTKGQHSNQLLAQRTIIISDQRTIARRLLFVLASFLPGLSGQDGLSKLGEDAPAATLFTSSSPSSYPARHNSLRRAASRKLRDSRLQGSLNDKLLSTSASSTESSLAVPPSRSKFVTRKESDSLSMTGRVTHAAQEPDALFRKRSAGTASTITPNPTTPVAYFYTKKDSYFPDGAVAEANESIATADLARILRRSSSSAGNSSHVSSRWGSLMSGISDLWPPRPDVAGAAGDPGGVMQHPSIQSTSDKRVRDSKLFHPISASSRLEAMVHDVEQQTPMDGSNSGHLRRASDLSGHTPRPLVAGPHLHVDEKDGVIDVDLELPGFTMPHFAGEVLSPVRRNHRPSTTSTHEGAESIRSLRSLPAASPRAPSADESNVAGYLRQYHEDFALHAVRPYAELEAEIKQSMSAESSPDLNLPGEHSGEADQQWRDICASLVADLRSFTIRKIIMKRKFRRLADGDGRPLTPRGTFSASTADVAERKPIWTQVEEVFVEEDVKDFDTTLADAIERVLNLTDVLQPLSRQTSRAGHLRTVSNASSGSQGGTNLRSSPPTSQDSAKPDCRQVVIAALEEVVKDVNDDLSKGQTGRDIHEGRPSQDLHKASPPKQENILREGVKRWLLNVEATRVW